jgi:hypothetical protein
MTTATDVTEKACAGGPSQESQWQESLRQAREAKKKRDCGLRVAITRRSDLPRAFLPLALLPQAFLPTKSAVLMV